MKVTLGGDRLSRCAISRGLDGGASWNADDSLCSEPNSSLRVHAAGGKAEPLAAPDGTKGEQSTHA